MLDQIVIVGGGVAAMRCALELRERGYDGQLRMLSAESTPPYDRTLVSKALISGDPVACTAGASWRTPTWPSSPADNPTGRRQRRGMSIHVDVDRDLCIGSETCVRLAPGVFALDEEEISVVLNPEAADISKLRLSADACPTKAIHLDG